MLHKPLYLYIDEVGWEFCPDKPRLRHSIKILMTAAQFWFYKVDLLPGFYEVKFKVIKKRPMLVYVPLRKA
jgi:hypothetical protein